MIDLQSDLQPGVAGQGLLEVGRLPAPLPDCVAARSETTKCLGSQMKSFNDGFLGTHHPDPSFVCCLTIIACKLACHQNFFGNLRTDSSAGGNALCKAVSTYQRSSRNSTACRDYHRNGRNKLSQLKMHQWPSKAIMLCWQRHCVSLTFHRQQGRCCGTNFDSGLTSCLASRGFLTTKS